MIRVFTAPGCGPCSAIKRAFKSRGIVFSEVDATTAEASAELRALGYSSVPVTVLPDGTHWQGMDMELIGSIMQEDTK